MLFDGIYKNSDIWVNQQHVGHFKHGYLSFFIDITQYIHIDTFNTILIKVDNSDMPHCRWYSGAGIYRDIKLISLPRIYIPVWGTYVTTTDVSTVGANINFSTEIINTQKEKANIYLLTSIIDKNGRVIATNKSDKVQISDKYSFSQSISIKNPSLWSLSNPFTYTAKHELYIDNQKVDECTTSFGIRNIEFKTDGFYLNGEKVFLKGVNIHHDGGCEGAAISEWTMYSRLKTLKEMGCNAIRLSHNPHSPKLLDMCDTMGVMVIAEAFDKWEVNSFTTPDGKWTIPLPAFDFKEHWKEYTINFIDRDKNHPSIIMWSLGNEVVEADVELGASIMRRLKKLVNELDNTRPVTAAIQPLGHDKNLKPWPLAFEMDVVSYNYQSQFYKTDKEKYGFKIIGSETLPYYTRNNIAELNGEKYLPANSFFEAKENALGHFIWAGIDYFGEAVKPWPQKGWENSPINTAGFKKPFFYFMKSLYSDEPMVHVTVRDTTNNEIIGKYGWNWPVTESHWSWNENGKLLQVIVYSNCERVNLYLNKKLVGSSIIKNQDQGYFEFYMPFESGKIEAVGYINEKELAKDYLVTTGEPYAIKLSTNRANFSKGETSHIIAEVIDQNGTIVPLKKHLVEFNIIGPVNIVGLDNGDLCSLEPYKGDSRETRDGRCLLVIKAKDKGKIIIKTSASGLKSDELILKSE
jgi:beta-galactosidase